VIGFSRELNYRLKEALKKFFDLQKTDRGHLVRLSAKRECRPQRLVQQVWSVLRPLADRMSAIRVFG
jgi:hypothetical protein